MDLKELEPLLNMSPYALMILFGVWLVRWFQKEYWPHIKSKEINRESLFARQDILEALRSVENLLTIQLKNDKK